LVGREDIKVSRIFPLAQACSTDISFLSSAQYAKDLSNSQAGAVILSSAHAALARPEQTLIVTEEPYLYYARLTQWWQTQLSQQHAQTEPLVHATAYIHPTAIVHPTARIGPFCVVERDAKVGAHAWLKSRVSVGERCVISERVILHSGVVIGSDGFGFAKSPEGWVKIEQLGAVLIAEDVEIGANSCVDRGALQDTVIERGVKLDNLVQIAHNVHIGEHTAMAACVGVAGSAKIGKHCTIGGAAVVLGHLHLGDHVHISAASVVTKSISKPGHYSGFFPIDDNANWERNAVTLKQLHRMRERLRALEQAMQS
jgi:UDP-3-O-[3-hydroxymyristoyl] glucosamine N-acyltransferase